MARRWSFKAICFRSWLERFASHEWVAQACGNKAVDNRVRLLKCDKAFLRHEALLHIASRVVKITFRNSLIINQLEAMISREESITQDWLSSIFCSRQRTTSSNIIDQKSCILHTFYAGISFSICMSRLFLRFLLYFSGFVLFLEQPVLGENRYSNNKKQFLVRSRVWRGVNGS